MTIENITVLKAEEGKILTSWDGESYATYEGADNYYCPEGVDISQFYEISEADHIKHLEDKQHYIEAAADSSIADSSVD